MLLFYLQMLETPEDKHKFELVYEEYKSLMFHVAKKYLEISADAEDAVHQAFVSIAENIEKIDDPLSKLTKSYVITIAKNKAIDTLRQNNRHSSVPFDETFLDQSTMQQALEYCEGDTLSQCILKLPNTYRDVIIFKYVHGYSLRDIAKILNITEANAIKIDQRAKKKLEAMCKEEGLL